MNGVGMPRHDWSAMELAEAIPRIFRVNAILLVGCCLAGIVTAAIPDECLALLDVRSASVETRLPTATPPQGRLPISLLTGGAGAPQSTSSPYTAGSTGYDASYPQCSDPGPPAGAAFSVLGVNGGKAFTMNPCLAALWQAGVSPRALYLNTGYQPSNADKVTSTCRRAAQSSGLAGAYATAYAIGCSETDYSLAHVESWQPLMWWLDVETSNSWSKTDLELNRDTLMGAVARLASAQLPIGVYSTPGMWQTITGGWSQPAIDANWVAVADVSVCGTPGFSGAPVWLVQAPATTSIDIDWAC